MATMTSTTSPQQTAPSPSLSVLPQLNTDANAKRQSRHRSSSLSKDRLSTHSNISITSQTRSRPGSHVFPIFHSSLSYALVRDFAYPPIHPLHYGPLPLRASAVSTPVSEQRRLSDPPAPWDSSRGQWSTGPWSTDHSYGHQQLPAMSFGDGPPYSEDEDLHSPVFSTPRHRKNKSTGTDLNGRRGRSPAGRGAASMNFAVRADRGTFVGMDSDGSETYYVNNGDDDDLADDGPGGEFVTYPYNGHSYALSGAPGGYPGYEREAGFESGEDYTDHRYSRDFQFAVGCPDEEMHGKAVALFDFTREHENELPLVEGQVIFVSYRHGQGWLVAEDPQTGESGLVPEEFVRLLRDIEGGLTSLNGDLEMEGADSASLSPESDSQQESTPTDSTHTHQFPVASDKEATNTNGNTNGGGASAEHPSKNADAGDQPATKA